MLCSASSGDQLAHPGVGRDRDDVVVGLGLEDLADAHGAGRYWCATVLTRVAACRPSAASRCRRARRSLTVPGPERRPVGVALVVVGQRAEERQRRLVQVAVGGQRVAAPRAVGAVEGGEPAAGLAHDDVERGHVVDLELGLGGEVDGALGEQHVGPEVAVGRGCASSAASATGSRRAGRAPPSR